MIPPQEWKPCKAGYNIDGMDLTIPAPIRQIVTGKQGLYQQHNVQQSPITLQDYRDLAYSDE